MNRLIHKTALVTGAAGGIGAAIARLFAAQGATVIATDHQVEKLAAWAGPGAPDGDTIRFAALDVTNEENWQQLTAQVMKDFGKIDILVNNAGIYTGNIACADTSVAEWQKILDVNLTGPFLGCKTCIPLMQKNGGGSIINVASIAGLTEGNGAAYSASKGGLRLLTKDIAVAYAASGIRANTICPGGVLTPMTAAMMEQPGMDEMIKQLSPQGRIADPAEIAWGALFLASDESTFMTGADLTIDGGATAR